MARQQTPLANNGARPIPKVAEYQGPDRSCCCLVGQDSVPVNGDRRAGRNCAQCRRCLVGLVRRNVNPSGTQNHLGEERLREAALKPGAEHLVVTDRTQPSRPDSLDACLDLP